MFNNKRDIKWESTHWSCMYSMIPMLLGCCSGDNAAFCPNPSFGASIHPQQVRISLLIAHSCISPWALFLAPGNRSSQISPSRGPMTCWRRNTKAHLLTLIWNPSERPALPLLPHIITRVSRQLYLESDSTLHSPSLSYWMGGDGWRSPESTSQ